MEGAKRSLLVLKRSPSLADDQLHREPCIMVLEIRSHSVNGSTVNLLKT